MKFYKVFMRVGYFDLKLLQIIGVTPEMDESSLKYVFAQANYCDMSIIELEEISYEEQI